MKECFLIIIKTSNRYLVMLCCSCSSALFLMLIINFTVERTGFFGKYLEFCFDNFLVTCVYFSGRNAGIRRPNAAIALSIGATAAKCRKWYDLQTDSNCELTLDF